MQFGKLVLLFLLMGSLCLAAAGAVTAVQQEELSEKIIRLHVVANSDDEEDQRVKLLVRDAVLSHLREQKFEGRQQTVLWLNENLDALSDIALSVLENENCPMPVTVCMGQENYPVRHYDTFSLPAGEYLSLQIMLGSAKGKNWWCVVYPAICVPNVGTEFNASAVSAGFTQDEIRFITEDTPEIKIKFKLLEWIQKIK